MTITVVRDGDDATVAVVGDVDLVAELPLTDALIELVADGGNVVIDASGITLLDSCGMRALVRARNAAQDAGGTLRLVSPSEIVTKALKVTELDRILLARE
jgi:anti-anti-sigma factor